MLPPEPLHASPGWQPQQHAATAEAAAEAAAALGSGAELNAVATKPAVERLLKQTGAGQEQSGDSLTGSESSLSGSSGNSSSRGWQRRPHLWLFLSHYEPYAAVGVNWVMFGSSGLQQRPPAGPLASYTSCVPQAHWESSHVKVSHRLPLRTCC